MLTKTQTVACLFTTLAVASVTGCGGDDTTTAGAGGSTTSTMTMTNGGAGGGAAGSGTAGGGAGGGTAGAMPGDASETGGAQATTAIFRIDNVVVARKA